MKNINQNNAPICLFVYDRVDHFAKTIDALRKNIYAEESNLFIFSDGKKINDTSNRVDEVRKYIRKIDGFNSVSVSERDSNFGLAKSIVSGVTQVLSGSDNVIVLEDDMVTSPYFLKYMNSALDLYAHDERVASIHGYTYPVTQSLPEAFFLRGADCWGWATWRRAWTHFNPDGQFLLDELKRRKLTSEFDFNGAYPFSRMLKNQIRGKNDSWAIRWHASAFLANKLTLYPGRSLVHNIGNDNSGTHCGESDSHDAVVSATPIDLSNVDVRASVIGWRAFEDFFRTNRGGFLIQAKRYLSENLQKILS